MAGPYVLAGAAGGLVFIRVEVAVPGDGSGSRQAVGEQMAKGVVQKTAHAAML